MGDANYQRYFLYSQGVWRMLPHKCHRGKRSIPLQKVEKGTWVMIHQALHEQIRCDIGPPHPQ